jgi:hypothetical protein
MFLKFFLIFFVLYSVVNAQYEKIKIGKIDQYYKDKITQEQLLLIIKEIEKTLEIQLGVNVFDYSDDGKPIDILYLTPSKKKIDLEKAIKTLTTKKRKIDTLQEFIISKEDYIQKKTSQLQSLNKSLNQKIHTLNLYIEGANKENVTSKQRYNEIQKYIQKESEKIKKETNIYNQYRTKFNNFLKSYNQRVSIHNTSINQYNRLQRKIETLIRSTKEIKGAAKGYIQIILKTAYKNGKEYRTKETKNYMEKIEIYGFDSLEQLKTILAHEILHLVGVGHINIKGALMNPILQKNQEEKLNLTFEDIENFKSSF